MSTASDVVGLRIKTMLVFSKRFQGAIGIQHWEVLPTMLAVSESKEEN